MSQMEVHTVFSELKVLTTDIIKRLDRSILQIVNGETVSVPELNDAKEQVYQINKKVKAMLQFSEASEQTVQRLQHTHVLLQDRIKEAVTSYEQDLKEKEAEITQLRMSLNSAVFQQGNGTLRRADLGIQDDVEELLRQTQQQEENLASLQAQLSEQTSAAQTNGQKLFDTLNQMNVLQVEKKNQEQSIIDLQAENSHLRRSIREMELQGQNQKGSVEEFEQLKQKYQRTIDAIELQCKQRLGQMEEEQLTLEEEVKELRGTVQKQNQQIDQLTIQEQLHQTLISELRAEAKRQLEKGEETKRSLTNAAVFTKPAAASTTSLSGDESNIDELSEHSFSSQVRSCKVPSSARTATTTVSAQPDICYCCAGYIAHSVEEKQVMMDRFAYINWIATSVMTTSQLTAQNQMQLYYTAQNQMVYGQIIQDLQTQLQTATSTIQMLRGQQEQPSQQARRYWGTTPPQIHTVSSPQTQKAPEQLCFTLGKTACASEEDRVEINAPDAPLASPDDLVATLQLRVKHLEQQLQETLQKHDAAQEDADKLVSSLVQNSQIAQAKVQNLETIVAESAAPTGAADVITMALLEKKAARLQELNAELARELQSEKKKAKEIEESFQEKTILLQESQRIAVQDKKSQSEIEALQKTIENLRDENSTLLIQLQDHIEDDRETVANLEARIQELQSLYGNKSAEALALLSELETLQTIKAVTGSDEKLEALKELVKNKTNENAELIARIADLQNEVDQAKVYVEAADELENTITQLQEEVSRHKHIGDRLQTENQLLRRKLEIKNEQLSRLCK